MEDKKKIAAFIQNPLIICAVYLAIGFCIYSNSLEAPYYLDDTSIILNNPSIRITNFSIDKIKRAALEKPSSPMRMFGNLTFALNYYLHRYRVTGYHVTNLSIHIISGVFLFLFIRSTLMLSCQRYSAQSKTLIAFMAGLLWLVHPVNTQSVTYIVQRYNSLAAMFSIVALWLYIHSRKATAVKAKCLLLAGAIGSWLLALGSKQTAAILPLIVFIYEWYFFNDLSENWFKHKAKYLGIIIVGFILVALVYLGTKPVERVSSMGDFAMGKFTYSQRLYTQPRVVVHYLSLFFYPHPSRLSLEYDFPLSDSLLDPPTTFFSVLFLAGLIGLAVVFAKSQRLISFCILWFFATLAIESSFIPLAIIFEHRTYMPYMLLCLMVVLLLFQLIRNRVAVVAILGISMIAFSWWTYQRNALWADDIAFWKDAISKAPNNVRPFINLGVRLLEKGKPEEAIEYLKMALKSNPDHPYANQNLGLALAEQGKNDEALAYYNKALNEIPDFSSAHHNKADALFEQGQTTEAFKHYQEALRIDPYRAATHLNIGALMARQGKLDEAMQYYKKALASAPHSGLAYFNIAKVLEKKGQETEAAAAYQKAIALKPDLDMAYSGLGVLREKNGNIEAAMKLYRKTLEINPEALIAYNNMGNIYAKQGKFDKAITQYQKAREVDPDYALAYKNLADIYSKQNRFVEAESNYKKALELDAELLEAYNDYGNLLLQRSDIDGAIKQFEAALNVDPEYEAAQKNLAKTNELKRDIRAAIDNLSAAIDKSPQNAKLHYELANALAAGGQIEKAVARYQTALKLNPEFYEANANLAFLFMIHGRYADALDAYRQMRMKWPEDPNVDYNMACAYSRLGDPKKSIESLASAVEKGYDNWDKIKTDPDLADTRNSELFNDFIQGH